MNGDQLVGLLWVGLAMVLVASGLIARRLPMRRTLSMALLWVGIFALAFAVARAFAGRA